MAQRRCSTIGISYLACNAQEQRYLAIQHTDTVYANQGVCAYRFSLDSGGADEFGHLYITLQFNDKKGKALAESTLEVEPFGGSSATRYGGGFTEVDCEQVEQARSIAIIQATEVFAHNQVTRLPISTFTPEFHQPLKITVSGK
ncbi:IrmA family protein [Aeromonas veronii]|uniref:IrmA family protein n=1 Tax=Aeromonas veronii TaxID=654 RepID=UPI001E5DE623|nr:IrmA family protein [Aeromonas veronii]MCD6619161.1 IrmA family protein [Aeromonas veronii]